MPSVFGNSGGKAGSASGGGAGGRVGPEVVLEEGKYVQVRTWMGNNYILDSTSKDIMMRKKISTT